MILLYAYLCVEKLAFVYDLEMRVRGFQNIYRVSMISNISWNCLRFQRSGTHGKQINANMANMISLYLNFYLIRPMTIDHLTWMNWKAMSAMGRPCWRELFFYSTFFVPRSQFVLCSFVNCKQTTQSVWKHGGGFNKYSLGSPSMTCH